VSEGGSKIWAQDVPINRGMQAASTRASCPGGTYGPLETTLQQFNVWLLNAYRAPSALSAHRPFPAVRRACRRGQRTIFSLSLRTTTKSTVSLSSGFSSWCGT